MKKIIFLSLISLSLTIHHSIAQNPAYRWAKQIGSSGADYGFSIAIANGYVYNTGFFTGTVDFDPSAATSELVADSTDIFVSKFDTAGNFIWAKKMGGPTSKDIGYSIAIDNNENVYVSGNFKGTANFDPGASNTSLTSAGDFDAFILKLNSSGDFQWVKALEGTKDVYGYALAVDGNGDVYTTGWFYGTVDFNPSGPSNSLTAAGTNFIQSPWDGFIVKHSTAGAFQWVKQLGSAGFEFCSSIALDANKNIYVTGMFTGSNADFDPSSATANLSSVGGADIFVAKYDPSGGYIWAKAMGGAGDDWGNSLTLDGSGNIITTGVYQATSNFDPNGEVLITAAGANNVYDVYVSKLDGSGNYIWAKSLGGPKEDTGLGITVDTSDNVYVTGGFKNTSNFNPTGTADNFTALGGADIFDNFITKFESDGTYTWTQQFGGTGDDGSQAIRIDDNNSIYVTGGFTATTDFDPSTGGTVNLVADGTNDMFILKLDQPSSSSPGCSVNTPTVTVSDSCGSSTLTSTATTGTYLWSPGNETTQSITVNSGGTYSVTITEGSCSSSPGTGTAAPVTAPTTPTITVIDSCGSTKLIGSATSGTYLWSPGNETTDSITVATAGTYTLTITENGCTSLQGTATAAPIAIPADPIVSTPVSYCQNSIASALTATGTDLLWYTTSNGTEVGVSTAPTPSTATIGSTDYFVSQTVNGCLSNRATISVDITPGTAAPTVSNVDYCLNDAASPLTATGTALTWYLNALGGTAEPSAPTPSTASIGTTSYYVSQNQCGEGPRAQLDVTVNDVPAAPTVTATDNCGSSDLVASNYTGTILWSTTETTPSISVNAAGTYSVTQTINGCTSAEGTGTAAPGAGPVAPTVSSPVSYCTNSVATQLSATGTGLLWYTNASGGTGDPTTPTPTTSSVGSTNYYVSQTIAGCEGTRAMITVNVTASSTSEPTVTSPISYCPNETANPLTAAGTNLMWYDNATGGTGNSTAPTPSTSIAGSTNYYVSQTVGTCESDRAIIVVNVTSSSAAPTVSSPVSYCENATATPLSAVGTNLIWYSASTGGTGSSTAPTPSTTAAASYFVSQNVCGESNRAEIVVNLDGSPTVTVNNATFCKGGYATLTASGATVYSWSPETNLNTKTGATVFATPTTTTTYTVTGYSNSCSSTATSIVTISSGACVGIEENQLLQNASLYPNPNNGNFTLSINDLSYSTVTIDIINILGEKIFSQTYDNSSKDFQKEINLENLAQGIYYVKISTGDETKTLKMIIQ